MTSMRCLHATQKLPEEVTCAFLCEWISSPVLTRMPAMKATNADLNFLLFTLPTCHMKLCAMEARHQEKVQDQAWTVLWHWHTGNVYIVLAHGSKFLGWGHKLYSSCKVEKINFIVKGKQLEVKVHKTLW